MPEPAAERLYEYIWDHNAVNDYASGYIDDDEFFCLVGNFCQSIKIISLRCSDIVTKLLTVE